MLDRKESLEVVKSSLETLEFFVMNVRNSTLESGERDFLQRQVRNLIVCVESMETKQ